MEAKTIHRLLEYDFMRAQGGTPCSSSSPSDPASSASSSPSASGVSPSGGGQAEGAEHEPEGEEKLQYGAPMKFEWNLFQRHRHNPLQVSPGSAQGYSSEQAHWRLQEETLHCCRQHG